MNKDRVDIHQSITDKLVAAMEAGAGKWRMPWVQPSGGVRPVNVASGNPYRGINVVVLWFEAAERGYTSNVWGTYKQWADKGAQVRKGERSSLSVFFRTFEVTSEGSDETQSRMVARATPVFNADQVDGYAPPVAPPRLEGASSIVAVDQFVRATGAVILSGGPRAFYRPSTDQIQMPARGDFLGSKTSTPTEAYYSTLLHELIHWTGPKSRLGRDLSGRFGTQAYAMEELVAEIGAAFLCADLSISPEPRPDHAQYLSSWIGVLKSDKRAIFTAASKASQAFDFLQHLQGECVQSRAA